MPKRVDHKLRRESFVAAASRTVSKRGVPGATVRAVAKEAGYTTGALVHYVDSMENLLVDASKYAVRSWHGDTAGIENLPDRLEALRQFLHLCLPATKEGKENWQFFIGLWERSVQDDGLREQSQARHIGWLERITGLIQNARDAGDIPRNIEAGRATRVVVALISGIAIQVILAGPAMPGDEQRQVIDEWIVNWLKPVRSLGIGVPDRESSSKKQVPKKASPKRANKKSS